MLRSKASAKAIFCMVSVLVVSLAGCSGNRAVKNAGTAKHQLPVVVVNVEDIG